MKNSFSALALVGLAASGCAFAQSQVTIFGVVDLGVAHISQGDASLTAVSYSGNSHSRIGFRGTEDLGGGLSAGFWLEGALIPDTGAGAMNFQRRSTVGLTGSLGEFRVGREWSATYLNPSWFDPFQGAGVGQTTAFSMLGAPIRVSNALTYLLPRQLGGWYGQAQYAFGEEPSTSANSKNNSYVGARLGYGDKALNVAGALGRRYSGTATTPAQVKAANMAISYNFGALTPMAFWAREADTSGARIDAWLLGATWSHGVGEWRAAYSYYNRKNSGDDWSKLALGYVHNMSKRTALYGTFAFLNNKGASAQLVTSTGVGDWPATSPLPAQAGINSRGLEFGIRHNF
ncbi:porin [Variovorax sp. HJSM1_2]|uniref:porin n=1 Tax=Variovorax sp. HJSM1_2 TaxID=3366263 RepID=UPI003BE416F1